MILRILNKITRLHTLHILIFLLAALFGGSIWIGMFVQSNPLIKAFDRFFYSLVVEGAHPRLIDLLIMPFNYNFLPDYLSPLHMPSYFYPMVIGALIYIYIKKRDLFGWAFFCFTFGTILSLSVTAVDWHYVFRERPFLLLPSQVDDFGRMAWGQLSSYPSGHARETALYSTIIAAFIPKLKWFALVFIIFIAYSRVYIGAHYPTDAIFGALIGFLAALTTLLVMRELQIIVAKKKGAKNAEKTKK